MGEAAKFFQHICRICCIIKQINSLMHNLDHLVPVPSLFFIGGNGVPLEVVAGEVNVPELLHRITSVLEKSGKVVSPGKI